jgi:hypothetical protein
MTVFYILLPIGLLLIVVSLGIGSYQHWSISHGNIADGTVVENVPRGRGGSSKFSPRVEFRTKQERDVVFMTTFSSNPPAYNIGDKVKVVYDGDGEGPRILSFALRFGLAWALMGAGLALVIIAFGFRYGDGLVNSLYAGSVVMLRR